MSSLILIITIKDKKLTKNTRFTINLIINLNFISIEKKNASLKIIIKDKIRKILIKIKIDNIKKN